MRPENEARLRKIKKASQVLRVICKLLLVLVVILGIASVLTVTSGLGGIDSGNMVFRTGGLALGHRIALGLVTVAAWAVLFKAIYHLHGLFGKYSRGEIFTRSAVGQLRQFGIGCLLWGVMSWVWMLSLALSLPHGKTFRGNADAFAIGVAIIVIAWFMDMAVDLREENDLTV